MTWIYGTCLVFGIIVDDSSLATDFAIRHFSFPGISFYGRRTHGRGTTEVLAHDDGGWRNTIQTF
jgi:hypothetical protein